MKRPTVRIYTEPNVYIDREMNDEEFAQYQIDQADYQAQKAAEQAKAQAKAQLLAQLGITEEQAKLLLS